MCPGREAPPLPLSLPEAAQDLEVVLNIGATSMDAPARMAAGALSRSLDVQADAVGKLMGGATGQNGDQMVQAAMAEQGKGQKLNITV